MQANSMQTVSDRSAAYDTLQRVILQLATRPLVARQQERSAEFRNLVEQALHAYRNYMKAVGDEAS